MEAKFKVKFAILKVTAIAVAFFAFVYGYNASKAVLNGVEATKAVLDNKTYVNVGKTSHIYFMSESTLLYEYEEASILSKYKNDTGVLTLENDPVYYFVLLSENRIYQMPLGVMYYEAI